MSEIVVMLCKGQSITEKAVTLILAEICSEAVIPESGNADSNKL